MGFNEAIKTGFRKYIVFQGRARRSEFWYWALFVWLVAIALSIADMNIFGLSPQAGSGAGPLSGLWSAVTLIPNIAISVRRLHDRDKSGWWVLLIFIPIIGFIVLLIWFVQRGTEGPNRFGPDPVAGIELQPDAAM